MLVQSSGCWVGWFRGLIPCVHGLGIESVLSSALVGQRLPLALGGQRLPLALGGQCLSLAAGYSFVAFGLASLVAVEPLPLTAGGGSGGTGEFQLLSQWMSVCCRQSLLIGLWLLSAGVWVLCVCRLGGVVSGDQLPQLSSSYVISLFCPHFCFHLSLCTSPFHSHVLSTYCVCRSAVAGLWTLLIGEEVGPLPRSLVVGLKS